MHVCRYVLFAQEARQLAGKLPPKDTLSSLVMAYWIKGSIMQGFQRA